MTDLSALIDASERLLSLHSPAKVLYPAVLQQSQLSTITHRTPSPSLSPLSPSPPTPTPSSPLPPSVLPQPTFEPPMTTTVDDTIALASSGGANMYSELRVTLSTAERRPQSTDRDSTQRGRSKTHTADKLYRDSQQRRASSNERFVDDLNQRIALRDAQETLRKQSLLNPPTQRPVTNDGVSVHGDSQRRNGGKSSGNDSNNSGVGRDNAVSAWSAICQLAGTDPADVGECIGTVAAWKQRALSATEEPRRRRERRTTSSQPAVTPAQSRRPRPHGALTPQQRRRSVIDDVSGDAFPRRVNSSSFQRSITRELLRRQNVRFIHRRCAQNDGHGGCHCHCNTRSRRQTGAVTTDSQIVPHFRAATLIDEVRDLVVAEELMSKRVRAYVAAAAASADSNSPMSDLDCRRFVHYYAKLFDAPLNPPAMFATASRLFEFSQEQRNAMARLRAALALPNTATTAAIVNAIETSMNDITNALNKQRKREETCEHCRDYDEHDRNDRNVDDVEYIPPCER